MSRGEKGLGRVFLFFTLLTLTHASSPFLTLTGGDSPQSLPMAMWVWDARRIVQPPAQVQLLEFCKRRNVGMLYLAAYDLRAPMDQVYRSFNRKAHEAGVQVHALAGDPRWGKPRYHQIPLEWVSKVLTFNAQAPIQERFDGIHTDIEVYLLSKSWRDEPGVLLGGYLDLTAQIAKTLAENPEPILFGADVPFWFDDDTSYRILWNGTIKPPSHHVLDHVDLLTVMAYRNFSQGPDGTIRLVMMELGYAARVGKKIFVGQETQEGLFPKYVTFGGTSCRKLHEELEKIHKVVGHRPSFGGFAIHHYESFRKLCK